jgi:hypothetical protein
MIVDVQAGGKLKIKARFLHALVNSYPHDIFVIETRHSQIPETANDREENIVRVYDQTNRNNTPSFSDCIVLKSVEQH